MNEKDGRYFFEALKLRERDFTDIPNIETYYSHEEVTTWREGDYLYTAYKYGIWVLEVRREVW